MAATKVIPQASNAISGTRLLRCIKGIKGMMTMVFGDGLFGDFSNLRGDWDYCIPFRQNLLQQRPSANLVTSDIGYYCNCILLDDEYGRKCNLASLGINVPEYRSLWTGFEEDNNFYVFLYSVIAGCYQVTGYLGSVAFSKAIQAHDQDTVELEETFEPCKRKQDPYVAYKSNVDAMIEQLKERATQIAYGLHGSG
ncbi:hypothetical protein CASFOL_011562 [Castilleja foliolosa]|uniref:Uncharacterized protein n=1 Tax=Castilleja foliolosa TaxID=1961234 RepID=A0ABD3DXR3_9LAMI